MGALIDYLADACARASQTTGCCRYVSSWTRYVTALMWYHGYAGGLYRGGTFEAASHMGC
jgi:hypothetical protein